MADNLTFCINNYFQKYPDDSVKHKILTLDQFLKCFRLKEELTQSINISLESEEKHLPSLESPVQVFIKKLPTESLSALGIILLVCLHTVSIAYMYYVRTYFILSIIFLQVVHYSRYVCM